MWRMQEGGTSQNPDAFLLQSLRTKRVLEVPRQEQAWWSPWLQLVYQEGEDDECGEKEAAGWAG
jgi:hypothetical protein